MEETIVGKVALKELNSVAEMMRKFSRPMSFCGFSRAGESGATYNKRNLTKFPRPNTDLPPSANSASIPNRGITAARIMAPQFRPKPSQMQSSLTKPMDEKQSIPALKVDPCETWSREVALMATIPAFPTIVISGGLATTMLLWVYTHALVDSPRQTLTAIWRTGYVLTNEGAEIFNGLEQAKSNALTISAATSTIISYTTTLVSTTFAYRIASQFLELSNIADQRGETSQLPTPLQLGFLLSLFQACSLPKLGSVVLYMIRKGSRNTTVSPLLMQAITLVTFTYLLTAGVGLSDFFLHKNTSTVKYLLKDSETSPFPYGRAFNASLCYNAMDSLPFDGSRPNAPNSTGQYLGCNMSPTHVWGFEAKPPFDMIGQSYTSVTNTSTTTRGYLVSPRLSLATAATDQFPQDARSTFSASSVAVSTDCKGVKNCTWNSVNDTVTGCVGVGSQINATTPAIFGVPLYNQYGAIPNPFQFFYRFRMDVPDVGSSFLLLPDSLGIGYFRNGSVEIIATCNTSVREVALTWKNHSYIIDNSTPASSFAAGAIFGPTLQTVMPSYLAATIESVVLNANSLSEYETGLSGVLAKGMIDRASPLLSPTSTTAATTFSTLLVTKYPIMPLFIFLLFLYIYAILAISLLIVVVLIPSSHIVLERVSGEKKRVSTLALAHRSIVNPFSTIVLMFAKDHSTTVANGGDEHAISVVNARASVAMEESKLFGASEKASTDPPRVVVGLGGATTIEPMFGLWLKPAASNTQNPDLKIPENPPK